MMGPPLLVMNMHHLPHPLVICLSLLELRPQGLSMMCGDTSLVRTCTYIHTYIHSVHAPIRLYVCVCIHTCTYILVHTLGMCEARKLVWWYMYVHVHVHVLCAWVHSSTKIQNIILYQLLLFHHLVSGTWTPVKGKGSIPPPRTYHSSTSSWDKDSGCGQLLVFSGGAVGSTPVKDRKLYKFDPGERRGERLGEGGM